MPFKCDFDFKISFNDIHEPTCILCRTSFYVLFMLLNFQHDAICFVDVDIWNGEWGGGGVLCFGFYTCNFAEVIFLSELGHVLEYLKNLLAITKTIIKSS